MLGQAVQKKLAITTYPFIESSDHVLPLDCARRYFGMEHPEWLGSVALFAKLLQ